MLKALQEHKYIRIDEHQLANAESWLDLYAEVEDLLTASVFERLAYLSPLILGDLLRTLDPEGQLPDRWEGFSDFAFWPGWKLPSGTDKEPDVFFIGHARGGGSSIRFVVENKRENVRQNLDQWAEELKALENSIGIDNWGEVVFLALGGMVGSTTSIKHAFHDRFPQFRMVSVIGGSWYDLLGAVDHQLTRLGAGSAEARILEDIRATLNLHGIRPHHWLRELPARINGISINPTGWIIGRGIQSFRDGPIIIPSLDWRRAVTEPIQPVHLAFEEGELR